MRLSTRRSVSRAAVVGMLAATPLIAGWAAIDRSDEPSPRVAPAADDGEVTRLGAMDLAAFGEFEQHWLDMASTLALDETLRTDAGLEVVADEIGAGSTAEQIAAIDTSDVTVTVLHEEPLRPDDENGTEDEAAADDEARTDDEVTLEDEAAAEDLAPVYVAADGEAVTAERIHAFLDGRNAPMTDLADAIVAAGITHDVDPRVIVGIAVAESNAGERLPGGSHNAWGWGGSGRLGLAHWDSWEDALDNYAERLGALYDTDDVDRSFAQTYCPPNWRWWLDTVTWVIDEI